MDDVDWSHMMLFSWWLEMLFAPSIRKVFQLVPIGETKKDGGAWIQQLMSLQPPGFSAAVAEDLTEIHG